MGLRRLLKSLAWKVVPYARLDTQLPSGLRLVVWDRGAWGSMGEVFLGRIYDPFFPHLRDVRGWVDLGCNAGFFSLGLLDYHTRYLGRLPSTCALLGDASERSLRQAREAVRLNQLQCSWDCRHIVVGPPGEIVTFSQSKDLDSSIFFRRHAQAKIRYPTTALPALLEEYQGVFDLIKVDIEGAEIFLFQQTFFQNSQCRITESPPAAA